MSDRRCLYGLVWLALLLAPGCKVLDAPAAGKSPLQTAKPSHDSVGLEIFFARFPADGKNGSPDVWQAVDEQQLSGELRRRLAQNGFRAGIVSSPLPEQLSDILKISEKPAVDPSESKADLLAEPAVTKRLLQIRTGHRGEIIASKLYDELPLLARDSGQVCGRTYRKADCRFALKATPGVDNELQLELVPEVQYGDAQLRQVVGEGTLRLEPGRPRKCFPELAARFVLRPGQMLLFASTPDTPGSLGHYFFTDDAGEQRTRRLLMIRLAQAGEDELFSAGDPRKVPSAELTAE